MSITQTNRNQEWRDGQLVVDEEVEVDVTTDVVTLDLHGKARQALTANAAFLANGAPSNAQVLAQMRLLTRECSALIRLAIGADLLVENEDT